jgi:hypothetical protein
MPYSYGKHYRSLSGQQIDLPTPRQYFTDGVKGMVDIHLTMRESGSIYPFGKNNSDTFHVSNDTNFHRMVKGNTGYSVSYADTDRPLQDRPVIVRYKYDPSNVGSELEHLIALDGTENFISQGFSTVDGLVNEASKMFFTNSNCDSPRTILYDENDAIIHDWDARKVLNAAGDAYISRDDATAGNADADYDSTLYDVVGGDHGTLTAPGS